MTDTQQMKNFLGLKIEGDQVRGNEKRATQRPIEELTPYFEAVLASERVAKIRWTQYTPYFNDGEPCTFGVGDPYLLLVDDVDVEDADEEEYGYEDSDRWCGYYGTATKEKIGELESTYDRETHTRTYVPTAGARDPELAQAFSDLLTAFDSDAFEDALLYLFGDHATITINRGENIEIEEYEHE